jgi:hypothetical protein
MLKYEGFVKKQFLIVLRLRGIKIVYNLGQHFFKIIYDPFIFVKNSFPKFDPLTVRQVIIGKPCMTYE